MKTEYKILVKENIKYNKDKFIEVAKKEVIVQTNDGKTLKKPILSLSMGKINKKGVWFEPNRNISVPFENDILTKLTKSIVKIRSSLK